MTKLAAEQIDFMIRNGFAVVLSFRKSAKDKPFSCLTTQSFGENDVRGVWSYGHNGDSLSQVVDAAFDQVRRDGLK